MLIGPEGDATYGKLPANFQFEVGDSGYYSIVGLNNAGKTTALQFAFGRLQDAIYIPAERGLQRLKWDQNVRRFKEDLIPCVQSHCKGQPIESKWLGHGAETNPNFNAYSECLLPAMGRMLGHGRSLSELKDYLVRFSLGQSAEIKGDELLIDDVPVTMLGTGVRSLLTIVLALAIPTLKVIIIDEPELFLEPRMQKDLRDLLLEVSQEKLIIVATHSHLFLNRKVNEQNHNYIMLEDSGGVGIKAVENPKQLQVATFSLLGCSVEDLFFPANYLLVEGSSDQVIVERVLQLITNTDRLIQVVSSGGINNVSNKFSAVREQALPLIMSASPYSTRVVALIDKCDANDAGQMAAAAKLKSDFSDRLFELDASTIEEYMHEDIYQAAGLDKQDILKQISDIHSNTSMSKAEKKIAIDGIKKNTSDKLAASIEQEHLDKMPIIKKAVEKALATS